LCTFGRDANGLAARVAADPALRPAAELGASVVACPGTHWCSRGLTDTRAMAARIRERFAGRLACRSVRISGCPNGCAQSAVADIGLSGGRKGGHDAYEVRFGGGGGRTPALGEIVARGQSVDEVLELIETRLGEEGVS
jgi:sulfite reductase beta subunit-like hemoprotein